MPCPLLEYLTIIDTPGVLSGEKQRVNRGYSMVGVSEWFASRADMILLLFDAHKLDISDEFKAVVEALRGHDDKVRVVLNKADQVNAQQLMRVYGALMWSLGKVFKSPEVCRVYIGSFWNQPFRYTDNQSLFEMEMKDLMQDLRDIPRCVAWVARAMAAARSPRRTARAQRRQGGRIARGAPRLEARTPPCTHPASPRARVHPPR